MKRLIILIAASTLMACNGKKHDSAGPTIKEIAQEFNKSHAELYPIWSNSLGDTTNIDKFPNSISLDFRKKELEMIEGLQRKLTMISTDTLGKESFMLYELMFNKLETSKKKDFNFTRLLPVDQFFSSHLEMQSLANGTSYQPFNNAQDLAKWHNRLSEYLVWLDTAKANMEQGMKIGFVHPKAVVKKMIPQFRSAAKMPLEENIFYTPLSLVEPEDKEGQKIKENYKEFIANEVIPKHEAFADFLKNEYLASARSNTGVGALPDGKSFYENQVKIHTTTTLSPDSIFNLGMAEVQRIRDEMQQIQQLVGFEGSLNEFLNHCKNLPALMPYDTPEEVLAFYEGIESTVEENLPKLFNIRPKCGFEVKRVEAFREKSASASYSAGSPDGTRKGKFYVPIPDAENYNIMDGESLFLHEALPGHHFQIMLMLENNDLPGVRKFSNVNAFVEGWGLYCEGLGEELGLYTDPYQKLGMLNAEMHRAIRLVVDVGMHYKGWTREEAMDFAAQNEALDITKIESEIERYLVMPGQALGYKIGQLTLLRLRKKAKNELENKFDIREFHKMILQTYGIPLNTLETVVNQWIDKQKTT